MKVFFFQQYCLCNCLLIGCVGASPCGLVPPASPPALPMPPALPAPAAYTGCPPQNAFQEMPQNPYNPQGFPADPAMAPSEFNANALAQNTEAAATAKAKLLGGIKPGKKFVPHIPPMGRPQQGKPPYDPPPPALEPQVAGYGPAAGQLPYQQPLSYGPQGMAPPQPAGYAPQPVAGFAPQPAAGFPPPAFTVKFHSRSVLFILYNIVLFIYTLTPLRFLRCYNISKIFYI